MADFARWVTPSHARMLRGPSFRAGVQKLRPADPSVKGDGDFGHKHLLALLQAIQESMVTTVKLVERPGCHPDSIGQGPVDQLQRDLGLGAKLHLLGHMVFFRRTGLFAQFSGRYSSLSRRHWKPGAT